MRFAEYVGFAHPAEGTNQIIVPYGLIAAFEDKQKQARSRNYYAKPLIEQYEAEFGASEFTDYDPMHRLARAVHVSGLPDYLVAADPSQSGNVFFSDGHSASKDGLERERRRLTREVAAELPNAFPETQDVVSVFTGARRSRYAILEDTLPEARRICESLEPHAMKHAKRLLDSIAFDPVPTLAAVPASARAYEIHPRFQQLFKNGRRALLQGHYEFDLTSAQMGIAATLWHAPDVQEFLRTNGCIWTTIAHSYSAPLTATRKDAIKHALYATLFGASKEKAKEILDTGGNLPSKPFFDTPQVASLIKARNRYMNRLIKDGHKIIGGRRHTVTWRNVRRVMAIEAQYYEQVLLNPAIQLGIKNALNGREPLYTIMAYTFDGFIARLPNDRSHDGITRKAQEAVQQTASKLNIYTKLNAQYL